MSDCSAPVGSGVQGSTCTDDAGCARGFACVDPDGAMGSEAKQCLHWCDVATGGGCSGDELCFGFGTPARVGTKVYGLCF